MDSEVVGFDVGRKQGLPKLREILRRNRQESDVVDCPDIDFKYDDADTHLAEISELYSYTEEVEFGQVRKAFQELMEEYGIGGKWGKMTESQRKAVILRLLDQVELCNRTQRLKGLRAVLYLTQGVFDECECEEAQQYWQRQNCFLLYEMGVFEVFLELLSMETDNSSAATSALRKPAVSLADSTDLRIILSVLYTICEVLRVQLDSDTDEMKRMREVFRAEVGQPVPGQDLMAVSLLGMITRFCSGNVPHFPIKKILLLLWKVLLVSLGGMEELKRLKCQFREDAGLPPVKEDTVEVTRTMRAASPPASATDLIEAQQQKKNSRPFRRTLMKQSSMDDSMAFQDQEREECNEDELQDILDQQQQQDNGDYGVLSGNGDMTAAGLRDDAPCYGGGGSGIKGGAAVDGSDVLPGTPRPSSPIPLTSPSSQASHPFDYQNHRGLPWTPKIRQKDIDSFLNATRMKFVGFPLLEDQTSVAGLPLPIHEGLSVLKQHVYVSLAEEQIRREEEISRNPISRAEVDVRATPAEVLFHAILPNLPQYTIALLKILLAAAPTSKAKTESINIISDILPEEMPMTVLQSMKLGLEVNRHKEIIVKAVSAILLLLLKHLKVNHVYQFEFMSQHLVFANCIPLVLKFFNQNIMSYVQAKNTIPIIDFPSCVIGEQPELTNETLYTLQNIGDSPPFCWRNMFSCINLLRILNKLTKWKQSRIMMLVVFKSAPILKRALKVKHAMMQLYVLKLLKMQTKYLGRQWRKSNMKTMSAIYQKVRHRLNDDWAYGNDVDARPWDFQAEECALRAAVDRFNNRRYGRTSSVGTAASGGNGHSSGALGNDGSGIGGSVSVTGNAGRCDAFDYEPVDNCVLSVLGRKVELTEEFKRNYEIWLYQEVFQASVNWDQLLCKRLL